MPTFTCNDFNNGRRFTADTIQDAGQRIASALARRTYGRRSIARLVRLDSHSIDVKGHMTSAHFEATAGRALDKLGTLSVDGVMRFTVQILT